MSSSLILGGLLSLLIGLSLGLLGGGGSILTVPILVYVLGLEPKSAIATSLIVVGLTSGVAMLSHARGGRVQWRTGLFFGVAGMAGAYGGGKVAHFIPGGVLLLGFAVMMLVAAVAMMRDRKAGPESGLPRSLPIVKVLIQGVLVGFVTGLIGAGGGFVVVPALVLLGGLPMHVAVGTSLFVIMMNSLSAFAGYIGHAEINWTLASVVSGAAMVGSVIGGKLAARVPQKILRKIFAWFIVVMGIFMLSRQLPEVLASLGLGHPSWQAIALGLVGVVIVPLLVYKGRKALSHVDSPKFPKHQEEPS